MKERKGRLAAPVMRGEETGECLKDGGEPYLPVPGLLETGCEVRQTITRGCSASETENAQKAKQKYERG